MRQNGRPRCAVSQELNQRMKWNFRNHLLFQPARLRPLCGKLCLSLRLGLWRRPTRHPGNGP